MPWKREQNNFWQIRLMRECSIETPQTRKENMRKSAKITVLAAIVVVMLAGSASADTTWSGLGGKPNSDGNWNDAANWDPAQVPGVGDTAIVPDVTSDADCRRMAKTVADKWGRCDVLVNNAATTKFVPHRNMDDLSGEDFQRILNVNVTGVYLVTRAFADLMRKTPRASVANISSMGGVQGTGSCMAYGASKAALNAMTMALARVLAPEVRVNAVLPGFITGEWLLNGMGEKAYEGMKQAWVGLGGRFW